MFVPGRSATFTFGKRQSPLAGERPTSLADPRGIIFFMITQIPADDDDSLATNARDGWAPGNQLPDEVLKLIAIGETIARSTSLGIISIGRNVKEACSGGIGDLSFR